MIIKVRAKPNSDSSEIIEKEDYFIASLKSPPEKNQANLELIKLLCKKYGVDHRRIKIKSGASSNHKIVEVDF